MNDWLLVLVGALLLTALWIMIAALLAKTPVVKTYTPPTYPVRIRPRRQKNYLCLKHIAAPKILGILYVLDNGKCEICKKEKV